MKVDIIEVSPSDSKVQALFKLLDEHNLSHCPPEVCHLTQPEELEKIDSILLGIYCDNKLCGMGGLKLKDTYAEVTRMYVEEVYRGIGLALLLLKKLEKAAISKNRGILKLETSHKFESAYNLYKHYGFRLCEPFGEYVEKPYNTYMEKIIEPKLIHRNINV